MRLTFLALAAVAPVFLTACNSGEDQVALGGLYRSTTQLAGADVNIDFDLPDTESGAFQLGGNSEFRASLGSSSSAVRLSGFGLVNDDSVSVTVEEFPDLSVLNGEVDLAFVGFDPTTLTGTVSEDGKIIRLGGGSDSPPFVRQ